MSTILNTITDEKKRLQFSFAKKVVLLLIIKQAIAMTYDLFFFGNKYLFVDSVVILTIVPCYIFTLVSPNYAFEKIGKLTVIYLIVLNTILTLFYYKDFPSIIIYMFPFTIALLFFYSFINTVIFSTASLIVIPISFVYNYYFAMDSELARSYYYRFYNIFIVLNAFILFIMCLYYILQIQKLEVVSNYLSKNKITIDGLYLFEKGKDIKVITDEHEEQDPLVPVYEKLFLKIEELMYTKKPWKDPAYNLRNLTRDVNSNTQYVSSAINNYTKNNFKAYLNEFRLNAFIESINNKDDDFSLEEVYLTIGFYNRSTFNRVFRAKFKMTPQEYMAGKTVSSD